MYNTDEADIPKGVSAFLSFYGHKNRTLILKLRHFLHALWITMRMVLNRPGKGVKMYFEVYADSFLLLQFVMNCYVLVLVNNMLRQKVRLRRILWGAFCGTIFSLVPFFFSFKMFVSVLISFFMSVLWLAVFTFQINRKAHFLKVLEKMGISTILLGGGLLVCLRLFPKGWNKDIKVVDILLLGGLVCGILTALIRKNRKPYNTCRVTLFEESQGVDATGKPSKGGVSIEALIDTGNSLIEPISGKPAAVLDKAVFEQIYGERKPSVFRVIPYHSVGRKNGVLPGYKLEHIVVETEENTKEYKEVYIGVGEEVLSQGSTYKMILNPRMLE